MKHNFAISLQTNPEQRLIGVPLQLRLPHGGSIGFTVEWVDLWFFSDQTAILSFKASATGSPESSVADILNFESLNVRILFWAGPM
ncbi:MAG: hypothetical protein HOI91_14990 [Halieaceae bacterium]|nr:hypothetical protein [Halieaceae bacterium]